MRQVLLTLAALASFGLIAAVSIVGLGLYNVSVKVGHLPGVSWVLHTTFRNGVRLRAPPIEEVPDLSDPALIALGAGHYASACAPCHAAPGEPHTATMRAMLPEPPLIGEAIEGWQPNHLHWIVENGIKMSGMPAWPARQRGDEVWSVVAYLEALRQPTAPALPRSEEDQGPPGGTYCATCHGDIDRHVPRLDIQNAAYLAAQLEDYLTGARASGIMQHAASAVPPETLPDLAKHFAQRAARSAVSVPQQAGAEGRELATRGTRKVPACTACHGPNKPDRRPDTPALAGQDAAFLKTQLRLWRDGIRRGSDKMEAAARALSDAEINLLAQWFAAQAPEKEEH